MLCFLNLINVWSFILLTACHRLEPLKPEFFVGSPDFSLKNPDRQFYRSIQNSNLIYPMQLSRLNLSALLLFASACLLSAAHHSPRTR